MYKTKYNKSKEGSIRNRSRENTDRSTKSLLKRKERSKSPMNKGTKSVRSNYNSSMEDNTECLEVNS